MLLAGDIGGTKTDLAVFATAEGPRQARARAQFRSGDYSSLEAIVRIFLDQVNLPVHYACFAVAGPVIGGRAQVTNLRWEVDADTLSEAFGLAQVYLLNDLEAIAWAIPALEPAELRTINRGAVRAGGAIAVIAPGTGLGEAFLTWDGDRARYQAHSSEGGHADFAPADELQLGLLRYMMERYDHVSYENVCSGLGIPHIYAYLRDCALAPELPELAARLAAAGDPTPLIMDAAIRSAVPDPLAAAAIEMFVAILGAEAGNLALKVLATGGVYLAGGIPPRILPALEGERFLGPFRRKGRFEALLSGVPIHVVLGQPALLGAACRALDLMQHPAHATV